MPRSEIILSGLRRELQAAERQVEAEMWVTQNGHDLAKNALGIKDVRATAARAVQRIQKAIEYYDQVAVELDRAAG